MDIKRKRRVFGQGNSSSEYSSIIERAQSWSRGADVATEDIDAEKAEEDLAFGVPNPYAAKYDHDGAMKGGRTDGVRGDD